MDYPMAIEWRAFAWRMPVLPRLAVRPMPFGGI
jgi:hypothetical protein